MISPFYIILSVFAIGLLGYFWIKIVIPSIKSQLKRERAYKRYKQEWKIQQALGTWPTWVDAPGNITLEYIYKKYE